MMERFELKFNLLILNVDVEIFILRRIMLRFRLFSVVFCVPVECVVCFRIHGGHMLTLTLSILNSRLLNTQIHSYEFGAIFTSMIYPSAVNDRKDEGPVQSHATHYCAMSPNH